jgi:hypothetical protein
MKPGKALCLATGIMVVGLSGAEADCAPAGVARPKVPPAPQRYVAGQQGPSGGQVVNIVTQMMSIPHFG